MRKPSWPLLLEHLDSHGAEESPDPTHRVGPHTLLEFWQALDSMVPPKWELPQQFRPPTQQVEQVIQAGYKGRECRGPLLFAAVQYCATVLDPDPFVVQPTVFRTKEDVPQILRGVLAARADIDGEVEHSAGTMRAIHYAAGLGRPEILDVLLQAMVAKHASPEATDRELACLRRKAVNIKSTSWSAGGKEKSAHYAPIHDAVWFKRKEAVQWLLEQDADANITNKQGCTPLHLVAHLGYDDFVSILTEKGGSLTSKNDSLETPLKMAVNLPHFSMSRFHLLAASCHGERSSFLQYLQDINTLATENEQGAEEFIKVLLGRHETERATNDQKLQEAYRDSGAPAPQPLFIQSVDTATVRDCEDESEQAMLKMAEIMDKAPEVGARMLEVLVGIPLVQNLEHHPLPCRANLLIDGFEEPMICTYQFDAESGDEDEESVLPVRDRLSQRRTSYTWSNASTAFSTVTRAVSAATRFRNMPRRAISGAVSASAEEPTTRVPSRVAKGRKYRIPCWKYDSKKERQQVPEWHKALAPLPEDRNDDKEVSVEVLKMPDILDVRILSVLANTRHLNLFAEKAVQGIVGCLWHQLVKYGMYTTMFFGILQLFILFAWRTWDGIEDSVFLDAIVFPQICWVITLATGLKELAHFMWALRVCSLLHDPLRWYKLYLYSVDIQVDLLLTGFLLLLSAMTWRNSCMVPEVGWGRAVLAMNVLLRWFKIMYDCRSLPRLGLKIVCVLKSLAPLKEMLLVTVAAFFGFAGSAWLIRNNSKGSCEDECTGELLVNLFKALLLTDGDAFSELMMLPGADPDSVFASVLGLSATSIFSICVLNLLIAVYSNEYDRKERQAQLLFVRERAGICFRQLMEPVWPTWREQPIFLWAWWKRLHAFPMGRRLFPDEESFVRRFLGGVALVQVLLAAVLVLAFQCLITAAVLLSVAMVLMQFCTKRCEWEHPARTKQGKHYYLWICSRRNFNRDEFLEGELEHTNRALGGISDMLKELVTTISRQETARGIANVQTTVDSLAASLEEQKEHLEDLGRAIQDMQAFSEKAHALAAACASSSGGGAAASAALAAAPAPASPTPAAEGYAAAAGCTSGGSSSSTAPAPTLVYDLAEARTLPPDDVTLRFAPAGTMAMPRGPLAVVLPGLDAVVGAWLSGEPLGGQDSHVGSVPMEVTHCADRTAPGAEWEVLSEVSLCTLSSGYEAPVRLIVPFLGEVGDRRRAQAKLLWQEETSQTWEVLPRSVLFGDGLAVAVERPRSFAVVAVAPAVANGRGVPAAPALAPYPFDLPPAVCADTFEAVLRHCARLSCTLDGGRRIALAVALGLPVDLARWCDPWDGQWSHGEWPLDNPTANPITFAEMLAIAKCDEGALALDGRTGALLGQVMFSGRHDCSPPSGFRAGARHRATFRLARTLSAAEGDEGGRRGGGLCLLVARGGCALQVKVFAGGAVHLYDALGPAWTTVYSPALAPLADTTSPAAASRTSTDRPASSPRLGGAAVVRGPRLESLPRGVGTLERSGHASPPAGWGTPGRAPRLL